MSRIVQLGGCLTDISDIADVFIPGKILPWIIKNAGGLPNTFNDISKILSKIFKTFLEKE